MNRVRRATPHSLLPQAIFESLKEQVRILEEQKSKEDPRLSFARPEFKEAQRAFAAGLKRNFDRRVYPLGASQSLGRMELTGCLNSAGRSSMPLSGTFLGASHSCASLTPRSTLPL